MADINKIIGVQIDDNASAGLKKVDQNITKVTQSTKNLTQETKSHTQATLDNGGAMGLLNELTGGLAMTFKDASEAIGLAGVSLNSFKGIMIATGIGALVVAVGYLAENWDKVRDSITGAAAAQEEYNMALDKIENNRKISNQITNYTIALLEKEKQEMIKNGATKNELANQDKKIRDERLKQINTDITYDEQQIKLANEKINRAGEFLKLQQKVSDLTSSRNIIEQKNIADYEYLVKTLGPTAADAIKQGTDFVADLLPNVNKQLKEAEKQLNDFIKNNKDYGDLIKFTDKLEEDKLKKLALETDILKQSNEEREKNRQLLNQLKKEEDNRLTQLIKIRQAIEANVDAYEKEVNETDIQKQAKALNGQYIELIKIYDARAKLIEQQKQAQALAKEGGISDEETKQLALIEKEIKEYDKLIEKKTKSILQSPEADKDAQTRLDIIRLNGEAELAMLNGFIFDGLNLRSKAFEKERQMREDNLKDIVSKDEEALKLADEAIAKATNTEEYDKAVAVKNDIDKRYKENKIKLDEEVLMNEQTSTAFSLDLHNAYIERKTEIDNEYYERLSIVSQNLQGFLSQLQDEQLIKSKDLRNALLIAEKGLAIAGVVINTIRENRALGALAIKETAAAAASYAAYDFVGGSLHAAAAGKATAGIGLNTASAGISIASILATTLTSWNRSGGTGGSTGGGAVAPQAQFNIVGSSGTNQLAATIGAQQNQPVNAYVVGNDVSTQQSLDRNRINNATFLSWIPYIGLLILFI